MKVVERKETDVKVKWSPEERVLIRAWSEGPYEICINGVWVRFVPGTKLVCRTKSLDLYLQEIIEFQLYYAWMTLAPAPDVGDELEVAG